MCGYYKCILSCHNNVMIFEMQSSLETDIIFLHLFLSIPCLLSSSILHCTLKKTSKRYTLIRPSGATGST